MWLILSILLFTQDTLYISENRACEMAIKNSPLLRAQLYSTRASHYKVNESKASFLPAISLQSTYTRLSLEQKMQSFVMDSLVMISPTAFKPVGHEVEIPFSQKDNYAIQFGIQQNIFTFGKLLYAYKAAKENYIASLLSDTSTQFYIEQSVRQLYTYTLVAREYLNLTKKIDTQLFEHYTTARNKYAEGNATDVELLQAEVNYKNNKTNIINAETQLASMLSNLKLIIGIPDTVSAVLTDSLSPPEDMKNSEFNVENRFDIRQMQISIESMKYQKKILDRMNFPNLFGAFNYSYQKPFGFENVWKGSWNATIGLQFNIFDGFKSYSQSKELESSIRQMQYLLSYKKSQAQVEVNTKRRELKSALHAMKVSKKNLQLAQKLYDMVKRQYEDGLVSNMDYMDAETNLFAQRINYINSIASVKIAQLNLDKALMGYSYQQGGASASVSFNISSQSGGSTKTNMQKNKKGGF